MDVLMPQLGETVTEGKITIWFKSIGDPVKAGENLFEIETDKVSMEIQAIAGGVLAEIRVPAGDVASVGTVVAIISDAAGAKTASAPAAAAAPRAASVRIPAARSTVPVPVQPPGGKSRPVALDPFFEVRTPERNYGPARLADGTTATPLARRLAAEAGLDLSRISGTGPHGRTFAHDVEGAIGSGTSKAALVPVPVAGASAERVKAIYRDTPYEEIPLDGMRRIIAQRLTLAKQTVPHFYLTADVEIDQLIKLREETNAAAPRDKDAKPTFKLSVNDIVIKAWAAALQQVPIANAVWAGDRILRFRHSDIGVAVAIEGGLFTPLIRKAETKTLAAISTEMQDLAARARTRRLKPHEYEGGSSAISNLGMYGIREFSAIINPPHATVLAVGATRRQAVEKQDGGVAFATVMTVTLSCDHRVVDGAVGAELIAAFRELIENPGTALV